MKVSIDELIGSYRIVEQIGSGGMGVVYRAEHTLIGKPVAIKMLHSSCCRDPEVVTRFFNEAKAASAISHPGIVAVHDFGYYCDDNAYIVMEYLDGVSLGQRLDDCTVLSVDKALAITGQVASALAAAHAKNIIHRDLKPDNVILVRDPDMVGGERIKLLDFGVAKLVSTDDSVERTRNGLLLGTPKYMAPEQSEGSDHVDGRSDLYSLGCLLYRMLCGCTPFSGRTMAQTIMAHVNQPPPPPRSIKPDIPEPVEALILRLLAKKPGDRFQSAKELLHRLKDLSCPSSPLASIPSYSSLSETLPFTRALVLSTRKGRQWPVVEFDGESTMVDPPPSAPPARARAVAMRPKPPPLPALPPIRAIPPAPREPISVPPSDTPSPWISADSDMMMTIPAPSGTISGAAVWSPNIDGDDGHRPRRYIIPIALILSLSAIITVNLLSRSSAKRSAGANQALPIEKPGLEKERRALPSSDPDAGTDTEPLDDDDGAEGEPPSPENHADENSDRRQMLLLSAKTAETQGEPDEFVIDEWEENDATVTIQIITRPSGARVHDVRRKPLGRTPFTRTFARDTEDVMELILSLAGYEERLVDVSLAKDFTGKYRLKKLKPKKRWNKRKRKKKEKHAARLRGYRRIICTLVRSS